MFLKLVSIMDYLKAFLRNIFEHKIINVYIIPNLILYYIINGKSEEL